MPVLLALCADVGITAADVTVQNPHPSGFGFFPALAASGNELAVANLAAPFTNVGGQPAEIDVFAVPGGAFLRPLAKPAEVASDQNFGVAIAWLESGILVGAPAHTVAGAAFLLDPVSGAVREMFHTPEVQGGNGFGSAVAGSGTRIAVGDDANSAVAFQGGAVYLFDAASGGLVRRLVPSDPVMNETFGTAMAFADDGDVVVLGSFHIHRFSGSDGSLRWRADRPRAGSSAIAVLGPWVVLGGYGHDGDGEVDLFDGDTGELRRTIPNPSPLHVAGNPGQFGATLASVGPMLVVGAPGNSTSAFLNQGQAFLFDPTDGRLLRTFASPAPRQYEAFAAATVAIRGGVAMVDRDLAGNGAEAFLFSLPCGNGVLDPGEQCDDGNLIDGDGCSAECQQECDNPQACNSGPACTAALCTDGLCFYDLLRGLDQVLCKVANLADAATCGSKLPRSLHLSKVSAKAATLLRRAAGSPAPKAERLRARAVKGLQKIRVQIVRLTHRERLTAECSASIDVRVQEAVGLIQKLG